MLFDLPHILILLFSAIAIAVSLILLCKFVKTEEKKNLVLKIFAVLTVVIHISSLWVSYFTDGTPEVDTSILIPTYPCHISMWLLMILAFKKNKKDLTFKILSEITFYLGTIGGVFGIVLNFSYAGNPNLGDWNVLQGFLSHDTLIAGSLYLLFGSYMKIRVNNMIGIVSGLLGIGVYGWAMIGLHYAFGISSPNCMALLEPIYPSMPWINPYTISGVAIVVLFAFTVIYEYFALKPNERWYNNLKKTKLKN